MFTQAKSELVNRTRELVQILDRSVCAAQERQPGTYARLPTTPPPSPLYFIDTDAHDELLVSDALVGGGSGSRSRSTSPMDLGQPAEINRRPSPISFVAEIEQEFNQYDFPELHMPD